jgi:hypothetical protein
MTISDRVATMQIETTTTSAADIAHELSLLYAERSRAVLEGLSTDPIYMTDLLDDITAHESAFICVAVTEIATLRAELGGPLLG